METILEAMIGELNREAGTTRRVLDRIPEDKLEWRPHARSMTLGQLAFHVAAIPAALSQLAALDNFDAANANFESPQPTSKADVLATLEASTKTAAAYLNTLDAAAADGRWQLTSRGTEIFAVPRSAMLRDLLFNHWYHHRGQLSVYLRLLDIPVPVVYGRSADEDSFASTTAAK